MLVDVPSVLDRGSGYLGSAIDFLTYSINDVRRGGGRAADPGLLIPALLAALPCLGACVAAPGCSLRRGLLVLDVGL